MKLPKPDFRGLTFEEALIKRRSLRDFTAQPLTLAELSQLVFAAQGITGKIFDALLRTAPSAGALYPYEIYLVIHNDDLHKLLNVDGKKEVVIAVQSIGKL